MKLLKTTIEGPKIIKSKIFNDNRGFFKEVYQKKIMPNLDFPFDIMSYSTKNVIRGLHIQIKKSQAKIITVTHGKILDIAVDLRKKSKTFGKTFKIILSDKNNLSLYIPEGFAHAYYSYEKENIIYYKLTNYYKPKYEDGINSLDKKLKISWPGKKFLISKKDKKLGFFNEFKKKYKYL
jgi:dTDP-4-dehydrorhamnose 3,5-epimerase